MAELKADERLLISKAQDSLRIAEKQYIPKTLGFLNPYEKRLIQREVLPAAGMNMIFDGGYEQAERTMLVCYPEYCDFSQEEYLCLLKCQGRELSGLSHRDYLGSLMGLGITRENIGDILVTDDGGYIFVKQEMAEYILQNLTKIGRRGVHIEKCLPSNVTLPEREVKEVRGTVSSLRLDAVLSTAICLSRGKTADLIKAGLVEVNWENVQDVSAGVKEGDIISARGYGRMELSDIGGLTRKGRYSITVSRFI